MITAVLFAALQLSDSITAFTVRDGERTESVPIVLTRTGPLVRASELLDPLGATLSRRPPDGFVFAVAGTRIEFTLGLPFASVDGTAAPLAVAPLVRDGEVFLPLAVVTEILPRHAREFRWDSVTTSIVRTRAVVERRGGLTRAGGPETAARPPSRPGTRRPLVVVDAGHGGRDRGMSGLTGARKRIYEADITLAVARKLRAVLQERGIDVLMTRNTDTLIALADRGRIANNRNGTLFLSIHVNAANPRWRNPRSARGFETYFLSDAKTEDERRVAEMENDADRYLDLDTEPGDPLSFLLSDMRQNEFLRESSALASAVQAGLKPVHPSRIDRGVKQAAFTVLVAAHMPAVLIEVGFGTNAVEAAWLGSVKGQQQLANAIAKATEEYLADYARRGGATLGDR
jgi:N-acetylmuramoyl-L-alanine amidase